MNYSKIVQSSGDKMNHGKARAMIACLDVHYFIDRARAAAVVFNDWTDAAPATSYSVFVEGLKAYQPGKFYLRELKPLMAVIGLIGESVGTFVIDAYCYLSAEGEPGLGAHLYSAIDGRAAVIGVAKSRFRDRCHAVEVLRGRSKRPLYVTATGMPPEEAAAHITAMSGMFRIPALLKTADNLARTIE